ATGANQDGHTNGITVPSGPAQQALIRKVCASARIDPTQVRYVEAHGTGTPLGDPTECKALGQVYGLGRPEERPCLVGSVKSSIGHLEAAAGIAGVIKAALCLHHRQIPPQANLETLNPNIPFAELRLRVSQTLQPMPDGEGPALVAVNSFGYGGTNAHAILSEAPESAPPVAESTPEQAWLIPLSARCEAGLKAQARGWLDWLEGCDPLPSLSRLGRTAGARRTHHDHRLAIVANDTPELIERLRAVTAPDALSAPQSRLTKKQAQRPVLVLTGMGPQWWAMGRQLLEEEPLFRQTAETIDARFRQIAGWSILEEMRRPESESRITETRFAQPANFVVQVGLFTLMRAWGVEPGAIVGHSLGEVSAAYIAGALSFEDAILVSYHRSRLQQKAVGAGKMLAVGLPPEQCTPLLAPHGGKVVIAAINSPTSSNLAGDAAALAVIAQQLDGQGVFNRFLRVDIPYHSPAMDPLKPELREALREIQPRVPTLPLYSTVTGLPVEGATWDAEYWVQNLREPVLFAAAVSRLIQDGYGLFVEVGPHPVLGTSIQECLSQRGAVGETLFTLNRTKPERITLLECLGKLYACGYPLEWARLYPEAWESHLPLPLYPWQRERYWPESELALRDRLYPVEHALLGFKVNAPRPTWESQLNPALVPFLSDHRVEGSVVFPGAGYVELGLSIHRLVAQDEPCLLERLQFHQALVIGPEGEATLRMSFDPKSRQYTVHSQRGEQPDHWTLHASGTLSAEPLGEPSHLEMAPLHRL
ncbi:MAG: type I polyketide synthase, partial [Magnetococcales bacterium]|nr:type I polyketide synthase [Magnetococcales bacterium]